MIKLFEENGLTVTKQDISAAINQKSGELSDDELDNVNGGIDLTFLVQEVLKLFADKAKDKIIEQ